MKEASERWKRLTPKGQQPFWQKVVDTEKAIQERLRQEVLQQQFDERTFERAGYATVQFQQLEGEPNPRTQRCRLFLEEGSTREVLLNARLCVDCSCIFLVRDELPACYNCSKCLMKLTRDPFHDHYLVCPAYELPMATVWVDEGLALQHVPAVLVPGVLEHFLPDIHEEYDLDESAQALLASAAEEMVSMRFVQSSLLCEHRKKRQVTPADMTLAGQMCDPTYLLGKLRAFQQQEEEA